MNKYSVTPTFQYTDEDMIDIISSAVYDIGYWACIDNERNEWYDAIAELPEDSTFEDLLYHILKKGEHVIILDTEHLDEEDTDFWQLTMDAMLNGIKLTIEHGFWNGKLDDIDGEVGDIIFQYSLFGEITFG